MNEMNKNNETKEVKAKTTKKVLTNKEALEFTQKEIRRFKGIVSKHTKTIKKLESDLEVLELRVKVEEYEAKRG